MATLEIFRSEVDKDLNPIRVSMTEEEFRKLPISMPHYYFFILLGFRKNAGTFMASVEFRLFPPEEPELSELMKVYAVVIDGLPFFVIGVPAELRLLISDFAMGSFGFRLRHAMVPTIFGGGLGPDKQVDITPDSPPSTVVQADWVFPFDEPQGVSLDSYNWGTFEGGEMHSSESMDRDAD